MCIKKFLVLTSYYHKFRSAMRRKKFIVLTSYFNNNKFYISKDIVTAIIVLPETGVYRERTSIYFLGGSILVKESSEEVRKQLF